MQNCMNALRIPKKLILHEVLSKSTNIQSVRGYRKPRWLPTAKSKLFKVKQRPKVEENEVAELKRLHDRYHTHMHAVRRYFTEEAQKMSAKGQAALLESKEEEEDHLQCMKENDEWNKGVALVREERLVKEREEKKNAILQKLIASEERKKARKDEIEQMVREEKERSKFYITPENIDKAIEDALANPVDYNFSIDVQGNIYRGRKTKPNQVPPEDVEKIQVPVQAS